jgi:hypothetical protein
LKGEISLQYKAGYDNAVKQVLYFASRLKPWRSWMNWKLFRVRN